jgi:hypothetical protein
MFVVLKCQKNNILEIRKTNTVKKQNFIHNFSFHIKIALKYKKIQKDPKIL